jgi:hypothetical protein
LFQIISFSQKIIVFYLSIPLPQNSNAMTKAEHLSNKTSPKRILALDGGGIRGALSLGYLQPPYWRKYVKVIKAVSLAQGAG